MRIPLVVTAKQGENPCHLKGAGFLTMFVSQELADPKDYIT